jgi:hypothetical protein
MKIRETLIRTRQDDTHFPRPQLLYQLGSLASKYTKSVKTRDISDKYNAGLALVPTTDAIHTPYRLRIERGRDEAVEGIGWQHADTPGFQEWNYILK